MSGRKWATQIFCSKHQDLGYMLYAGGVDIRIKIKDFKMLCLKRPRGAHLGI